VIGHEGNVLGEMPVRENWEEVRGGGEVEV
jgi:hypothetical protein